MYYFLSRLYPDTPKPIHNPDHLLRNDSLNRTSKSDLTNIKSLRSYSKTTNPVSPTQAIPLSINKIGIPLYELLLHLSNDFADDKLDINLDHYIKEIIMLHQDWCKIAEEEDVQSLLNCLIQKLNRGCTVYSNNNSLSNVNNSQVYLKDINNHSRLICEKQIHTQSTQAQSNVYF
jgi:hypothetical protein